MLIFGAEKRIERRLVSGLKKGVGDYSRQEVPFTTLVDAGWQFPPPKSFRPLLEFTCRPRLKPYVEGADSVSFMVVARVRVFASLP